MMGSRKQYRDLTRRLDSRMHTTHLRMNTLACRTVSGMWKRIAIEEEFKPESYTPEHDYPQCMVLTCFSKYSTPISKCLKGYLKSSIHLYTERQQIELIIPIQFNHYVRNNIILIRKMLR